MKGPHPTLRLLFCPLPSPQQAARLRDVTPSRLSSSDNAHIRRFTAPGAADARLLARALLVLACRPFCPSLPATLYRTASGAPALGLPHAAVQTALSFAYSPQAVVCALALAPAACRLGVDLESLASPPPAPRAFHPREHVSGPRDALRRWTVKEALLKAHGTGLTIDPAGIPAGRAGQRRGRLSSLASLPPLYWRSLPLPGHWCALALSQALPLRLSCLTCADVIRALGVPGTRGKGSSATTACPC